MSDLNRKFFTKLIFVFLFCFSLTSCSSVRVKYKATIIDDYFESAEFEYERSLSAKKTQRMCMLTFFALGGFCWSYLTLPSEQMQSEVASGALAQIEKIFGPNNFRHRNIEIKRFGWSQLPNDYRFVSGRPLRNNFPFYHQHRPVPFMDMIE